MRSLTVVIPRGPGLAWGGLAWFSTPSALCWSCPLGTALSISAAAQSMQAFPVCLGRPPQALGGTAAAVFFRTLLKLLFTASWSALFPCFPRTETIPERKGRLFLGRILAPLDFVIPSIEGKGFSSVTETIDLWNCTTIAHLWLFYTPNQKYVGRGRQYKPFLYCSLHHLCAERLPCFIKSTS